jgi:hydroxypyruvate isomerase
MSDTSAKTTLPIQDGSIRQSFAWWAFAGRGVEDDALLRGAAKIGYDAVDLIDEPHWAAVKKAGLSVSAIIGHGTIENGLNRRENAARIEKELRANIEKASRERIPVVVCFSGNRAGLSDSDGLKHSAETLASLAPVAANAGVVLAVELLNSKVDHADYQCDHTQWGVELCQAVNSPSVKLLYDIYHMQIMEGDVIRTIQKYHSFFAYYHTGGNPGRGQPDRNQEINYAAIYRAIQKTGYSGYISHEFVPVKDPLLALKEAYDDCLNSLSRTD